ncbi:MAG: Crp/Fnr family transcriptional regulator [Clostridia bacterium]|nr:Crp/Fnr family transcriptional regulator [Clostridia bacterium]
MDERITEEMKERFLSSFLFAGLPRPGQETEEEMLAKTEFFAKGECVYKSDRFYSALGVIVSGTVRVTTSDGENRVILRDMSAGETFGAAALFGAGEYYVSTIHAQSACAVVFIDEKTLEKLFMLYPQAARNYISFLSSKIRYLNRKIAELSLHGAGARLLGYMKQHAGTGGEVDMPSSMSALAKTLGIGRSSLYRAFEKLEAEGLISKNENIWIIKGENTL